MSTSWAAVSDLTPHTAENLEPAALAAGFFVLREVVVICHSRGIRRKMHSGRGMDWLDDCD